MKKQLSAYFLFLLFPLINTAYAQNNALVNRVLVVENLNSPVSIAVANDYMTRRGVPNVLGISCPDDAADQGAESINYPDYQKAIEAPLIAYLSKHNNIDFIVFTKGVPIRIFNTPDKPYGGVCSLDSRVSTLGYESDPKASIINVSDPNYGSDYVGNAWANKFWNSDKRFTHAEFGGYLVSRLDGYTQADAIALTTRALQAESNLKNGVNNRGPILLDACSDFGFPNKENQPYTLIPAGYTPGQTLFIKHESDYGEYNSDMSVANDYLTSKNIPVLYDSAPNFIGHQSNLRGYISWGSNDTHYDPEGYNSLQFAAGALAETAVSTSARTFLPTSGGQSLIEDLIAQGVTGAKGYTDEPLLQGIASPSVLFNRYTRGWTLAESFFAASRLVGWMGTVVGDPICQAYTDPLDANATLTTITLSPNIKLSQVSGNDLKDFTARVNFSTRSVTLTPVTKNLNGTIKINGVTVPANTASAPISLQVGDNVINTVVTAQDGVNTNVYSIKITRTAESTLTTLSATPATTLRIVDGPDFKDYEAVVDNPVSSITLTPAAADPSVIISVNGHTVQSGTASQAISLTVGTNIITTTVTDGTVTNTYRVKITRHGPPVLLSLTLNPAVALSQVSGPDYRDYTARVGNSVSSITLTPKIADATNIIRINDQVAAPGTASASIPLSVGDNVIVTTVSNGELTNTYQIKITRLAPAVLTAITVSPNISLKTTTGPDFKDYTATAASSVASVTVTATTPDNTNIIKVNDATVVSGAASQSIPLNTGSNTVIVKITDGVVTNSYHMVITREVAGMAARLDLEEETAPDMPGVIVHPNVSPNGDGKSDRLLIENIRMYPDNQLQIMTKNGDLIYKVKGYDNETKAFDGHSASGKLQPPGTYLYLLEYRAGDSTRRKTGYIVLRY